MESPLETGNSATTAELRYRCTSVLNAVARVLLVRISVAVVEQDLISSSCDTIVCANLSASGASLAESVCTKLPPARHVIIFSVQPVRAKIYLTAAVAVVLAALVGIISLPTIAAQNTRLSFAKRVRQNEFIVQETRPRSSCPVSYRSC